MTETILAIGAAGEFGGLVLPELAKRGARVRSLVQRPEQVDQVRQHGAAEIAVGDQILAGLVALDGAGLDLRLDHLGRHVLCDRRCHCETRGHEVNGYAVLADHARRAAREAEDSGLGGDPRSFYGVGPKGYTDYPLLANAFAA